MTIFITFPFALNDSVQVGDTAYYTPTTTIGTHTHNTASPYVEMGIIIQIEPWDGFKSAIHVDFQPIPAGASPPSTTDFILFSKDNKVNLSSILGYYAEVEFKTDSREQGELFSVGCEFNESSK